MVPKPPNEGQIPRPDMTRPQYYRAHALDDADEIVISGMSGRFPSSPNVAEYAKNLYAKVDMIQATDPRWLAVDSDMPKRSGQVCKHEKFDASLFAVHHMQAHTMDPQCRMILEEAYLAVMDAGINPNSIRGSRTGVYIASLFSETEKSVVNDATSQGGFGITGCSRAMYANRISYTLGLQGPSFFVDTACSSSMYALDLAYAALRSGEIDAAIVGGTHLIIHPNVTLHFVRLGVISRSDVCSPFDEKADGYVRAEGVSAIYLQRRGAARRVYATVVHSKTNCDGFKPEGITYPSSIAQEKLLREFYSNIRMSPDNIGYMEAHSTGTVAGDPEECRAIDNAICKQRSKPLLIGSVKSNIGHTEPVSGLCSVVKVMQTFQTGKIPPNINFTSPRKDIQALLEGRMKVITETTDLPTPFIAVNSFGFGGSNAHVLLKQFEKKKTTAACSEESLPMLCMWSGRTKESVERLFNKIESQPLDPEYVALLHSVQEGGITGMLFRGFNVLKGNGPRKPSSYLKDVQHYSGIKRPIVWVYSGMGSQWVSMGAALMTIPMFKESILRCHNVLKKVGVDLVRILTSDDPTIFDNVLYSFVGISAIQIALTDILKSMGMEPDYIIGHSLGEMGCAYADGSFTTEQMILAAYYRGKVSFDAKNVKGSMAAIGLSYSAIRGILPDSIEVACHNGPESVTISGPAEDVAKFVDDLKAQKVFAKEVPCANIAFHTRYIAHLGAQLLKYLKQIIPNPKKRSLKWLSTSIPQQNWSRPESMLSSAEYHTNNLISSVLFEETCTLLPSNALTIEIAPHALLQSILRSAFPGGTHVGLTKRNSKDNHMVFLAALGKLYANGLDVPVGILYPKVEWPVSRGTETISDIVELDHRDDWNVYSYSQMISKRSGERMFQIDMKTDDALKYLSGHNIDGKVLIPATFYLECVWQAFSKMYHDHNLTDRSVEMENVRFLRATTLTSDSKVGLAVMVQYGTGHFEIIEGDSLLVSGVIREIKDATKPDEVILQPFDKKDDKEFSMSSRDFYKELKLRGYYYSGDFKAVESVRGDGQVARLAWNDNWVTFIDCMLQTQIIKKDTRDLCLPTKIGKLRIFGQHHLATVGDRKSVDVLTDQLENRVVGGGVELSGLEVSMVQRRKPPGLPVLERYQFVPHFPAPVLTPEDIGRFFVQLALENDGWTAIKIAEILSKPQQQPLIEHFLNAVEDLPLITGEYTVLSSTKYDNLPPSVTVEEADISKCCNKNFIIDQTGGGDILKNQDTLTDGSYLVLVLQQGMKFTVPLELSMLAICPLLDRGLNLMLLRKNGKSRSRELKFLKISSNDTGFTWLKTAQEILSTSDLVLVAENDRHSGLLGLTNCLRKEYSKTEARCLLIDDASAPAFSPENSLYANQLALGMAVNIYRKGRWGTYRHLKLNTSYPLKPCAGPVYANILHRGDLSSLKWLQGRQDPKKSQIKVVYSSLNFKDIMLATGRISADTLGEDRVSQDCVLGLEFAGIDTRTGRKIMGMVPKASVANYIEESSGLTMEVPSQWSLRDAATVPVVYYTVYYAFFIRSDIRKGKSILIHAGTGGIGLSAIRVALAYGLEVFTTVSTIEKRNFLLKAYPQLKESHIGNSRDTSFERMIRKETKGKGVDFVLNSLSEEKLLASVKCLGKHGVFLEIGKFDMASDNQLGMAPFLKEISFVAVLLDVLVMSNETKVKKELRDIVEKDIKNGIIQPLPSTVYPAKEVEQAFRFLASAKHIGKVLIQVCDHAESEATLPMGVMPVVYFSPELVYIVPGGLGGFGLELIDWMVLRGARRVVISSSRGISNGYQSYRIRIWKSYGCTVHVSMAHISTKNGCEMLLKEAMTLGHVGGIFNLAVVLKDGIFANQTVELFLKSFAPKALATMYLDELSRKLCPKLEHFLIFSSVSCGRGNAGQTNYGMANSIMERIIEDRAAHGLPAKAIQWGAVGEVGLVAVMAEDKIDLEIGGTLQQRISSCLRELDTLLLCTDPLVASMVVAEKRLGESGSATLIEAVMNVMGIRDTKSVSHGISLSELGMDSLMSMDIKQTLEKDFDLFLSPQDLRSLTFQKLEEISQSLQKNNAAGEANKPGMQDIRQQINIMVRNLGDEANYDKVLVPINGMSGGKDIVFLFPGIECTSGEAWTELGKEMHAPSYVVQLNKTSNMGSFDEMADFAVQHITSILKPGDDFRLVGYSFGSIIVAKVAHCLERLGRKGRVVLIDGSPSLMAALFSIYTDSMGKANVDAMVLSNIANLLLPDEPEENSQRLFLSIATPEERLAAFQKVAKKQKLFSERYVLAQTTAVLHRCKLVQQIDVSSFERMNAPICLIKPTSTTLASMAMDYDLGLLTNSKVAIETLDGNHSTILGNSELPRILNEFLQLVKKIK